MAHLVLQFSAPVRFTDGRSFAAAVHGQEAEDGLWDGWIEFAALDGSRSLRTPRETRQPNRADLDYWASGLTAAYLEGALTRAQREQRGERDPASGAIVTPPVRPQSSADPKRQPAPRASSPRAVLDPFKVFEQGEDVLRKELAALDQGHLRNILLAYHLLPTDQQDTASLGRTALEELIVSGVQGSA
ncbi:hypothetical protein BH23GEM6_BH23GEM6_13140 [soil metagenome]